jgi:hypothetical protein
MTGNNGVVCIAGVFHEALTSTLIASSVLSDKLQTLHSMGYAPAGA